MAKDNYKNHLYALIMAGGGGTRLWPRSRNKTPKQFLKLFGSKTLTEITGDRLSKLVPWERIFVATATSEYKSEIVKLLPKVPKTNISVEPERRDTAPAHGLGAVHIFKEDPDAVIINAASDHFISPEKNYRRTMLSAAEAAYSGDWMVAVGIKTLYPHTGLGHIKRGKKWKVVGGRTVYKLDKFVEKPPLKLAKKYHESSLWSWNANHYVWRADTYLNALRKHAPEIAKGLDKILDAIGKPTEEKVLKSEFQKVPKISVDYAVSEKANNFLSMIADYSWTDIGDWNEVWKNLPHDELGNVLIDGSEKGGSVINFDTSDALIHTNGRLVAVIDVDNIVVVDTKDALLICSKSKSQKVKQIVNRLKEQKRDELL